MQAMDGRVEVSSGAVMPGANGFGYFPRKESNPRRWTARKRTGMSCRGTADESLGPGLRRDDDLGFPADERREELHSAAQRRCRRKLREPLQDCRADASDIESGFGEQLLAAAVFEEDIRQAEVQHGHFDAM